ncbi:putative methyl-independent mismatch repair protein [Escherichia coli]|uniref:Putative methyl-independent mismatch repair protein n=1 Tax=Escherichia coli TaxID=562 RepID=A0A376LLR1_ECOLX|nr:putative methyl-independent mismatch repair protein [Escherichia coli]
MLLAGSSLLTLLDDIATLLDDISVMGKLAAKKTAGVLGDDLSLNCATSFRRAGQPGTSRGLGRGERIADQ